MGHVEEVAHRLKGLRDALGLTAAEIAAACGIDEGTYVEYESGNVDDDLFRNPAFLHVFGRGGSTFSLMEYVVQSGI